MRKSKFILATIVSLFLVNEVSINPHSNDITELINTNTSIADARGRGGGRRSGSSRSRSGSFSKPSNTSPSTQPRDSKPKSTNNNTVTPKTNNTPPSTKPSPASSGSSNRGGSFSKPSNTTNPTTNNVNTGGKTRSGSFTQTTKQRYSVEPDSGRRYYLRPGTQERYYQEAGTRRFYYVEPGTQRRYYINTDNGQRYLIAPGTKRYYYEEVGTSRFSYVHPTTRVRYYYRPTFRERIVYTYYDGTVGAFPTFLLVLLLAILMMFILYELVLYITSVFGYRREVLVVEGDEYVEVIEESPGCLEIIEESPGCLEIIEESPGYVEIIEESPGYVEIIEESPGYVEIIEEEPLVANIPEDLDNDIVTVTKLQVAMVAPANNIQSKLARISEEIDIETAEGRVELLLHSSIALLQNQKYWTHVTASSETVETRQEAERIFEQFSFAERSKFEVNTVDENVELDHHIVVTLLLGTEDDYPLFGKVNNEESFKKTLKQLGKVTPDYLLVFELIWSPETASDRLTYEQFVSDYGDMIQIS